MSKIKYNVSFKFNVAYSRSRLASKIGIIQIESHEGELDIEAAKKDQQLIAKIIEDVQGLYKKAKVFSLDITGIQKLK